VRTIQLTQGMVALVDDEDYPSLSIHNWFADEDKKNGTWYAKRNIPLEGGKQTTVRMHCEIAGQKGIDHHDRNGLNNQRYNLRPASESQNAMNRRKPLRTKSCTSIYKGVCKVGNRWYMQIYVGGERVERKSFTLETDAAKAYDESALHYFGEFARINFPDNVNAASA
jgi:hypothetical protein